MRESVEGTMDPEPTPSPEVLTLTAGPTSVSVLPRIGFTISSLRHHDQEYLSFHGGVDALRQGHTTGVPLLAPWANRLRGPDYESGGQVVQVVGAPGVHLDANGLPIHGTMVGRSGWRVGPIRTAADHGAVSATFDAGADAGVMASFPFPHTIAVELDLVPGALSVRTTLTATGAAAVPVSFGWHPYVSLPDRPSG